MLEPLTHVEEYGDEIIVYVDLPFVKKEDISVYLRKDLLEIKAIAKTYSQIIDLYSGFLRKTSEYKSFRKILRLPCEVDEKTARAKFQNGILRIILKKKVKKEIKVV